MTPDETPPAREGPEQFPGGPYLQMAVLCEKVLREEGGVLSLIRIVDRITVSVSGPSTSSATSTMPVATVQLMAVISFRSGMASGSLPLRVRVESPSHRVVSTIDMPVLMEGGERGPAVIVQLVLQVDEDGLYWIAVALDNALVTKLPLRIVYQRVSVS